MGIEASALEFGAQSTDGRSDGRLVFVGQQVVLSEQIGSDLSAEIIDGGGDGLEGAEIGLGIEASALEFGAQSTDGRSNRVADSSEDPIKLRFNRIQTRLRINRLKRRDRRLEIRQLTRKPSNIPNRQILQLGFQSLHPFGEAYDPGVRHAIEGRESP